MGCENCRQLQVENENLRDELMKARGELREKGIARKPGGDVALPLGLGARRLLESIVIPSDVTGARVYPTQGDVLIAVAEHDTAALEEARAQLPGVQVWGVNEAFMAELVKAGVVGAPS